VVDKDVCGRSGAHRQDLQIGLEPTPDAYVARMVEVFREARECPEGDFLMDRGGEQGERWKGNRGTRSVAKPILQRDRD
jgi:hypothetical protein